MRRTFIYAFSCLLVLALCSCVANKPYRSKMYSEHAASAIYDPERPDDPHCSGAEPNAACHPYFQSYIEFDEFGEMWDFTQLEQALGQIDKAANAEKPVLVCQGPTPVVRTERGPVRVIIFIHGWKNNASEKSGNVWGFRDLLSTVAKEECKHPEDAVPLVGVYIGWRGAVSKLPVVKEFTYWDRHRAAQEIPGSHLTFVLNRLAAEAKHPQIPGTTDTKDVTAKSVPRNDFPDSKVLVIGHSFGGQVLERSVSQGLVQFMHDNKLDLENSPPPYKEPLPFDLIVLINEAAPATESIQMLDYLRRNKIQMKSCAKKDDGTDDCRDVPLIVSMTSKGDTATGIALPAGQTLARLSHSTHAYKCDSRDPACRAGISSQSTFYIRSTANLEQLRSHELLDNKGKNVQSAQDQFCDQNYCIKRLPSAWNTTPYWVMQLPVEVVPDHSTVFGPELQDVISLLLSAHPKKSESKLSAK